MKEKHEELLRQLEEVAAGYNADGEVIIATNTSYTFKIFISKKRTMVLVLPLTALIKSQKH